MWPEISSRRVSDPMSIHPNIQLGNPHTHLLGEALVCGLVVISAYREAVVKLLAVGQRQIRDSSFTDTLDHDFHGIRERLETFLGFCDSQWVFPVDKARIHARHDATEILARGRSLELHGAVQNFLREELLAR